MGIINSEVIYNYFFNRNEKQIDNIEHINRIKTSITKIPNIKTKIELFLIFQTQLDDHSKNQTEPIKEFCQSLQKEFITKNNVKNEYYCLLNVIEQLIDLDEEDTDLLFDIIKRIYDMENAEKIDNKLIHKIDYILQKISLELWKDLMNSSLKFLGFEHEQFGVQELYNYQKSFREFEEVLYSTKEFYRDHVIHSINLYLMGEMIFRDGLKINKKLEEKNKILYENLKMYTPYHKNDIKENNEQKKKEINDKKSAIFCFISMTHDLGYPIEVIHLLGNKYRDMYKHFKNIKLIEPSVEFPLAYQEIFKYLNEVLTLTIKPIYVDKEEKEVSRSFRHPYKIEIRSINQMFHIRPQISTSLIEYNHGLFSCMKLIEHLRMFKDNYHTFLKNSIDNERISINKLNEINAIEDKFLICLHILKTIIYHSTENIRISEKDLIYIWFNLLDDLCEWSRTTKGKGYTKVPGFCTTKIESFNMDKVEIIFEYDDNTPHYVEPHKHFEILARKYYQIIYKENENDSKAIEMQIKIKVRDKKIRKVFEFKYEFEKNDEKDEGEKKLDFWLYDLKEESKDEDEREHEKIFDYIINEKLEDFLKNKKKSKN